MVEQSNLLNFTSSCLDKGINISSLKRSWSTFSPGLASLSFVLWCGCKKKSSIEKTLQSYISDSKWANVVFPEAQRPSIEIMEGWLLSIYLKSSKKGTNFLWIKRYDGWYNWLNVFEWCMAGYPSSFHFKRMAFDSSNEKGSSLFEIKSIRTLVLSSNLSFAFKLGIADRINKEASVFALKP